MKLIYALFWGALSLAILLTLTGCTKNKKPRYLIKIDNTIFHCESLEIKSGYAEASCGGTDYMITNGAIVEDLKND
jgi:hypothetical protein